MIDSLEVGDLVRLNGSLRVVRDIGRRRRKSRIDDSQVYSVTFAIMRCSWTRKPYTVRGRCDLYHADLAVVQKGYGTERGPLDVFLQRDLANNGDCVLKCCDVIGIVS